MRRQSPTHVHSRFVTVFAGTWTRFYNAGSGVEERVTVATEAVQPSKSDQSAQISLAPLLTSLSLRWKAIFMSLPNKKAMPWVIEFCALLINVKNNKGPSVLACVAPLSTGPKLEVILSMETTCDVRIGLEEGQDGRVSMMSKELTLDKMRVRATVKGLRNIKVDVCECHTLVRQIGQRVGNSRGRWFGETLAVPGHRGCRLGDAKRLNILPLFSSPCIQQECGWWGDNWSSHAKIPSYDGSCYRMHPVNPKYPRICWKCEEVE